MEKDKTSLHLSYFLSGVREAGAEIELFYTSKLNISPCMGDLICWHSNPGHCFIQNDMQMLYPKLCMADVLVLATPVYISLPGDMQNFLNRMVYLMDPVFKMRAGRTRTILRRNVQIGKIVLVSTCDWWEKGNFGTALRIVKEFAENTSIEFAGAVLRPHANFLRENNLKARNILKATEQVSYELVKDGRMSPGLLKVISRLLIALDAYLSN